VEALIELIVVQPKGLSANDISPLLLWNGFGELRVSVASPEKAAIKRLCFAERSPATGKDRPPFLRRRCENRPLEESSKHSSRG
jgi:hypothetical protein